MSMPAPLPLDTRSATSEPNAPVPPSLTFVDEWQEDSWSAGGRYRILSGPDREIAGAGLTMTLFATQLGDGSIDDGSSPDGECPHLHLAGYPLNVEQVRGLMALLGEMADQMDELVKR